ncbi:hypothetical protein ILUMI_04592 [Ignelater luminosus]|uniref:Uncharacterized protein n=1 Tax=Ignelater luminosus TaxID=2038154 RepID=A0A8K0D8P0_IGNLU|nr:hypothetical protein ILUMI_04592 [Ignelater luminosus]
MVSLDTSKVLAWGIVPLETIDSSIKRGWGCYGSKKLITGSKSEGNVVMNKDLKWKGYDIIKERDTNKISLKLTCGMLGAFGEKNLEIIQEFEEAGIAIMGITETKKK